MGMIPETPEELSVLVGNDHTSVWSKREPELEVRGFGQSFPWLPRLLTIERKGYLNQVPCSGSMLTHHLALHLGRLPVSVTIPTILGNLQPCFSWSVHLYPACPGVPHIVVSPEMSPFSFLSSPFLLTTFQSPAPAISTHSDLCDLEWFYLHLRTCFFIYKMDTAGSCLMRIK